MSEDSVNRAEHSTEKLNDQTEIEQTKIETPEKEESKTEVQNQDEEPKLEQAETGTEILQSKTEPKKTGKKKTSWKLPCFKIKRIRTIVGKIYIRDKKRNDEGNLKIGDSTFAENIFLALRPYRIFMIVFGSWPLSALKNPNNTYTYILNWRHPNFIYFMVMSMYFILFCFMAIYNFATIMFYVSGNESSYRTRNTRTELAAYREKILVTRHGTVLISILTNLILMTITVLRIIYNFEFIADYFNFWSKSAQVMGMDIGRGGTTRESWWNIGSYFVVIFVLIIIAILQFGASSTGGPLLIAILSFKFFYPNLMADTEMDLEIGGRPTIFTMFHILGGLGFLLLFICSKIHIFLFIFKCRLLRNAFAVWNARVYNALLRGNDDGQTEELRTTQPMLFQDHCALLDLLEGTSRYFSGILEWYFFLQGTALCFEVYIVTRTILHAGDQVLAEAGGYFIREFDYIPSLVVLILNLVIVFAVAQIAAGVGDEAVSGLELIRRRTMLGRKTDNDLYFMMNLYYNFISLQRNELSVAGYYYINKDFILNMAAAIFSYFIVIYQYQPRMDIDPFNSTHRAEIGKFIVFLENGRKCSWLANPNGKC